MRSATSLLSGSLSWRPASLKRAGFGVVLKAGSTAQAASVTADCVSAMCCPTWVLTSLSRLRLAILGFFFRPSYHASAP